MMEAGIPSFEFVGWFAAFAPAGTPAGIIARLNAETVGLLGQPEMQERLARQGTASISSTPDELAAFQRSEITRWGRAVRQSGASQD
jgi:tripartite-type tricarboxylate transporter receptor subunit TctC